MNGLNCSADTVKQKRYRMPTRYLTVLSEIFEENTGAKRTDVRSVLIQRLGWETAVLPNDFPTEAQVRRKVLGLKINEKKKKTMA